MFKFYYSQYSYKSDQERQLEAFNEFLNISKKYKSIVVNAIDFSDLLSCSKAKGSLKIVKKVSSSGFVGSLNDMKIYVSLKIKPGDYNLESPDGSIESK